MKNKISINEYKEIQKKMNAKSKQNNQRTLVDDIWFQSKHEADRYCLLKIMRDRGLISNLELQPEFELVKKKII